MKHGISFKQIDNSAIAEAYKRHASADYIATLKGNVSFNATIGYQYTEVPFSELSAIMCNDYAYSPFRYKTIEEGATYNAKAFPNPYGGIRNKANVTGKCSWVSLDIDTTNISDIEFHKILGNINHHIARTSNPDNQYKYRVAIPLTTPVDVDNEHWKFFIGSIAKYLQCNIDRLPKSQLLIGYNDREVLSKLDGINVDPQPHLDMAIAQVKELEDMVIDINPVDAAKALQQPYSTFDFAYEAQVGNRWATSHAAIHKAKELGASREYIENLIYSINDFLDVPKPRETVKATLISAI